MQSIQRQREKTWSENKKIFHDYMPHPPPPQPPVSLSWFKTKTKTNIKGPALPQITDIFVRQFEYIYRPLLNCSFRNSQTQCPYKIFKYLSPQMHSYGNICM